MSELKNCGNCKHCKFLSNQVSPGGVMIITNYSCNNMLSEYIGTEMNKITSNGQVIDSLKLNTCNKHESK